MSSAETFDSSDESNEMDEDEDLFFFIILPVAVVIFVAIIMYLFIGYARLKKQLLNSGQVISPMPFIIMSSDTSEVRSPDGELPPPRYNSLSNNQRSSRRRENNNARSFVNNNYVNTEHTYSNIDEIAMSTRAPILSAGAASIPGPNRPPPLYSTVPSAPSDSRRTSGLDATNNNKHVSYQPPPYSERA